MSIFDTQRMLDNAATASQVHQLHEPVTRGAILRSVAQWIQLRPGFNSDHVELIEELQADPEFKL